jgi:glycosyltransferase involved in cell wall biosynthesis
MARSSSAALLHLNNNVESQPSGALAASLLGLPSVAHARSFQEPLLSLRIYLRLVDHHIAVSNAVRSNLLDLGVDDRRISVVADAIPVEDLALRSNPSAVMQEFSPAPGELRFGYFGRIVPWKGVLEFLRAAFAVMREEPLARAFVVGGVSDGDHNYMRSVESMILTSGFSDRIVMTGFRADIPQLMAFMDVVVHSSTEPEPFGMVLIEAMAARKPVVATKAGGPQDIVEEGETGFLVSPGSTAEMSAAILSLLQDPARSRAMGEAGFVRACERFGSAQSCRQVMAIYDRLLGNDDQEP